MPTPHHSHDLAVLQTLRRPIRSILAPLPFVVGLSLQLVFPATAAAQPPNDACMDATTIPSGTVSFNPPDLSTIAATLELCGAQESCEQGAVGSSNTVWYSYTPLLDGNVEFNTFGSTYDTVVSVHDGCSSVISIGNCEPTTELACNDNAPFGTASQLFLEVDAGSTYKIKVGDLDVLNPGGGLLDFNMFYRPLNGTCASATQILEPLFEPPLTRTENVGSEACEAQESCEFNDQGVSNSVWYAYTPPTNGFVTIDTNGSTYDTVLSMWDGCREFGGPDACGAQPTELACDDDAGVGLNSKLMDVPVVSGATILIKVADFNTNPGGGQLDFAFQFSETPLADAIFADGFESGDLTAWSVP